MCGICGFFDSDGINTDLSVIDRMQNKLRHRGPDDSDTYIDDFVALGFTRLSIIGLENGNQPIRNENGNLILVCNGEVFNYKVLKSCLISNGHIFNSESDVEVILHLYEEYGLSMFDYLNGQFAFALYNRKDKNLLLARDHFGVNPLFYTVINNKLIFASEIKAILEYPHVERKVDLTALDQVLSLPGVVSPRSMFQGINSLPPGHFVLFDDQKINVHEYWDINYPIDNDDSECFKDEAEYIEELRYHLKESIKLRMVSDVPVGSYLSGGLDSSIIRSFMDSINPTSKDVFCMTFKDDFFNEETYQDQVISHFNLNAIKIRYDISSIADRLKKVVWHSECPLKESYNTASLALSQSARENGIKVILTGEGSDEIFAGYPSYKWDAFRRKQKKPHGDEKNSLHLWGETDFFYEKNFSLFREMKKTLFSKHLLGEYDSFDFLNDNLLNVSRLYGRHPIHMRSYIDLKIRIADHLISDHGDRMLMANSVEGRYPFLDKDLLKFISTVPPEFKLNGYQEKYLLKKASEGLLPSTIIKREKFGFSAPGSPQLLQANIDWINDLLSYESITKQGYFNPDAVETLRKQYSKPGFILNIPYEEDLLMPIITFGIFLELFQMPNI